MLAFFRKPLPVHATFKFSWTLRHLSDGKRATKGLLIMTSSLLFLLFHIKYKYFRANGGPMNGYERGISNYKQIHLHLLYCFYVGVHYDCQSQINAFL